MPMKTRGFVPQFIGRSHLDGVADICFNLRKWPLTIDPDDRAIVPVWCSIDPCIKDQLIYLQTFEAHIYQVMSHSYSTVLARVFRLNDKRAKSFKTGCMMSMRE